MRSATERIAGALHRLETDANVWLATASAVGVPHLIPLSLAWDGARLLLATPTNSPTVRNATATGAVKAALDDAGDVVLIDGTVDVVDFASADPAQIEMFVQRVGWDPGAAEGEWSLLLVSPSTIRSWNSEPEITGRTIMKHGNWIS